MQSTNRHHGKDDTHGHTAGTPRASTASVDWQSLWREFGFDTPGADDSSIVSRTQLTAALSCSDQELTAGPASLIERGVSEAVLVRIETTDDHGNSILRGYVLDQQGGSR